MNAQMKKIYLYSKFERFWHWAQGLLIALLLVTGLELHGTYNLMGFEAAHATHVFCAWSWLTLYVFILFWMLVTGEWRQYTPTFKKIVHVAHYYMVGIFRGEPHPVPKTLRAKHNPLQRLTYLSIVSALIPFQMATGFLYYYYNDWAALGLAWDLSAMAALHTLGAFGFFAFVIVHIYMTTTGHSVFAHMTAMFTGWEDVEEEQDVQAWETKPEGA